MPGENMTQESIETTVARLDERFRGFQTVFNQMAADQRRMAESYEKLVESNHRVALLEAEVVSMKEGQKQLWIKCDDLAAEGAESTKRWLWEIAKTVLTVIAAVFAYKVFGVHL